MEGKSGRSKTREVSKWQGHVGSCKAWKDLGFYSECDKETFEDSEQRGNIFSFTF